MVSTNAAFACFSSKPLASGCAVTRMSQGRAATRAIHVDARYMLWVMQEVDHADNLLKEMTIKYPKK